jgi:hypothetical protein
MVSEPDEKLTNFFGFMEEDNETYI